MFSIADFITADHCLVDDPYKAFLWQARGGKPSREAGPKPGLSDTEINTMLVVGEFLGIDTGKGIHRYAREHWRVLFPRVPCRTTFLRQAAHL